MKLLSILIADDHAVVRRGLRSLLETQPGWRVCGEARNGREAVQKAEQLKPDLAILDISMPELNGLEAVARILKAVPNIHVLILTMHSSEELMEAALKAGAQGYVLKSEAERDLLAAVYALARGNTFFGEATSEFLLDGFRDKPGWIASEACLTHREREILQLLGEGGTNKEVAAKLSISPRTVENHRASIMQKLHLRSLSDLVRFAVRNRIVEA
jgi:DNA-binding NarL/FixJ family response regulator